MLFRTFISKCAAGKGRAILEGVGLSAEARDMCYNNHPLNEEEAVQAGLIKWRNGGGNSPTWTVLLGSMEYAEIAVQHINKLKEELLKGAVCLLHSCLSEILKVICCVLDIAINMMIIGYHIVSFSVYYIVQMCCWEVSYVCFFVKGVFSHPASLIFNAWEATAFVQAKLHHVLLVHC